MSGIAGILWLDGRPVDHADLERMREKLAHRGPDGSGVWSDGAVGLVHNALWTTPESVHEKLPLANNAAGLAITADARIDNRAELIAGLGIDPQLGQAIGDAELILRAYEKWGDRCVEHLLGDFAFAIWDGRRQVLFCARDHMGVKPFYYHRSEHVFAFATEIKGILTLSVVPRRLNETRVGDYLVPILHDKEITFFEDILRLPPAHTLRVGHDVIHLSCYWSLDPKRDILFKTNDEYAEAFREIFTESVRCRLRSAYPIGSLLSGGLDSSSIVCVARKLLTENGGGRLHTISAIFDEVPECDERVYINAVLAQGELEPHYVHPDRISPLANLERMFWHEDEAFYAPNLFQHWALSEEASRHNIRVLLDGNDGDTTVSHGVAFLPELARSFQCWALLKEVRGLARNFGRSRRKVFWNAILKPMAPRSAVRVWRRLHGRVGVEWASHGLVSRGFAERIGISERFDALERHMVEPARSAREDHWRRLTWGGIPILVETADRAVAARSVEPRYPFFDRRLVEFCLALPPEQKIHHGWTRVVMRRALDGILPREVRWRGGKSDFSPNFTRGLLAFERERVERVVLGRSTSIDEYVEMAVLREAYRGYASNGSHVDVWALWRAVVLALWLGWAHTLFRPEMRDSSSSGDNRLERCATSVR